MRPMSESLLPINPDTDYARQLNLQLKDIFRNLAQRVNAISDGQISAIDNAATTAPTTGTYSQGDVIRNKAPTELGAATAKYIVTGFTCVLGGTPGTWIQNRTLTGN